MPNQTHEDRGGDILDSNSSAADLSADVSLFNGPGLLSLLRHTTHTPGHTVPVPAVPCPSKDRDEREANKKSLAGDRIACNVIIQSCMRG